MTGKKVGFPVVLSAASGTGKTTLCHMLLESDPRLMLSVSFTTRAPRGDERDGHAYHFASREAFEDMMAQGAFIESAEVHGNYYGSSEQWTREAMEGGSNVLFDIDVQGGHQIRDRFPNACLIFMLPPSLEILEHRLRTRGTDDDAVIERRMAAARSEIEQGLDSYDYVLTNETLERALFDLTAIVRAHRLRAIDRKKIRLRLLRSN